MPPIENPIGPGDEADDGLEFAVRPRGYENERLHDLAELGAECIGGVLGGVCRLLEDRDVERDALARGCVEDPLDPRMVVRLGHGRSLAPGPLRTAVG